ncbi:MAG: 4-alpha-glucanotransferase [Gammaproteobacteria bacterium]|nr:4-alpha-glucanotransferase [Gammaproteobacteria bacterium]
MRPDCGCLPRREFGVLLHISSLPAAGVGGDLGPDAYRFVDFLSAAGAGVWQVLPLVPTHLCGSPYHGRSIHAGNQLFISVIQLHRDRLISDESLQAYRDELSDGSGGVAAHRCALEHAYRNRNRESGFADEFSRFWQDNDHWVSDYALYRVLNSMHDAAPWYRWPPPLRDREPGALIEVRRRHREPIEFVVFEQYLFWRQWRSLKDYTNQRGIRIMGDLPIFPAHDSAEVWSHPHYFQLDSAGGAINVAGVPPDYFSATGQRWGNPVYDWERLRADGFIWWVDRIRLQLEYFDLLRLDHFRGFESYWSIPAASEDAIQGRWEQVPGTELFETLAPKSPALVAEDLGSITPEVLELRRRFGLPGMRVLQFAFDGQADNLHLPHNHELCSAVYTGTHDNQTTLGWFQGLSTEHQQRIYGYLGLSQEPMPWALTRAAMASVSRLAMIPMQDVMALDDRARMNTPGTDSGNWSWRFAWTEVPAEAADRLHHLASVYGRLPG